MLSIEKRQALTNLLLLGEIQSVSVQDFDYGNGLDSCVTINAKENVDRQSILDVLYATVGAIAEEKEPHEPRGGEQAFPYTLYIEGSNEVLSNLFFVETQKEPSVSPESNQEITTLHLTTEQIFSEMVEREA
jgi:hypothetical protein